jgi:hypothetical protein
VGRFGSSEKMKRQHSRRLPRVSSRGIGATSKREAVLGRKEESEWQQDVDD